MAALGSRNVLTQQHAVDALLQDASSRNPRPQWAAEWAAAGAIPVSFPRTFSRVNGPTSGSFKVSLKTEITALPMICVLAHMVGIGFRV